MKHIIYIVYIFFTITLYFKTIVANNYVATTQVATVVKIIDGDTIDVKYNNKITRVRFLGINTPELFTTPAQPYATQAKQAVQKALANQQTVTLKYYNNNMYDKYNRLLAEVYINNISINQILLQQGLAFVYIIANNNISNNQANRWFCSQWQAINNNYNLWQNNMFKVISPQQTSNFINKYKVIKGTILSVYKTKNSVWLRMQKNGSKGFSVLVAKRNIANFNNFNFNAIINKQVLVHGFIEKYSPKYGALVNLTSPSNLFVISNNNCNR